MKSFCSIMSMLVLTSVLNAVKSPEAHGDKPIIVGTLTSQEGNSFTIANVTIGHSQDDTSKITLYEKPKNLGQNSQNNLTVNPYEDLTTTYLELSKVKTIEIPEPHVLWKWNRETTDNRKLNPIEFMEIGITWRSGSSTKYLIQLGESDSRRPLKVFCDVLDKPLEEVQTNGTLFCAGLKKADVRQKGAPFPSIKKIEFDEPCYKMPSNGGTVKKQS